MSLFFLEKCAKRVSVLFLENCTEGVHVSHFFFEKSLVGSLEGTCM